MVRKPGSVITCFFAAGLILFAASSSAEAGKFKLLSLKRSQDSMQKELARETETYNRLKLGIESGGVNKGMKASEILRKYGKPVIKIHEANVSRWVYKPSESSFFSGEKIYLFFSEDKILTDYNCIKE